MIKKFAWNAFKNTGDINAFLELKQIENIENEMNKEKGNKENGKIKMNGIILSEHNMGDFDKMLTMLTPGVGKICVAKGARRPKSALLAGTQMFCFGEYLLYKGKVHTI